MAGAIKITEFLLLTSCLVLSFFLEMRLFYSFLSHSYFITGLRADVKEYK
jgi:hypothetical protein